MSILILLILLLITASGSLAQDDSFDFFRIYKSSVPSVVMLDAKESGGTGFVVDRHGHIVTNAHVANGVSSVQVEFYEGGFTRGRVIGVDNEMDIAVIKVDVPCQLLNPISFSAFDNESLGQPVLGIGGPGSLSWDAVTGHVLDVNVDTTLADGATFTGLIETNLGAEPGYSGGPLIDTRGEVIGVTFAANDDRAFSIPATQAMRRVQEIIGEKQSSVDIPGTRVDLQMIERFGLYEYASGILVLPFDDGETLQKYGLVGHFQDSAAYDFANRPRVSTPPYTYVYIANIIYAIQGMRISSLGEITSFIEQACPGEYLDVDVYEVVIYHEPQDVPDTFATELELDNFFTDARVESIGSLESSEAYITGVNIPLKSWNVSDTEIDRIIVVGVDGIPINDNVYGLREYILQRLGNEVTLNIISITEKMGSKTIQLYIPITY